MRNHFRIVFFVLCIHAVLFSLPASAQDKKDSAVKVATNQTLSYVCTSDDSILLSSDLFIKTDSGNFYLANALVRFQASGYKDTKVLGEVKTDSTGKAVLKAAIAMPWPKNKEGMTTYTSVFDAKGKYLVSEQTVAAKPAKIKLEFAEEDSVRYIKVSVIQMDQNGKEIPVGSTSVIVYVPRLFSNLKIGEISLEANGTGKVEFPSNLVAEDSAGNIRVIAQIEDHDLFGNVRATGKVNWAIPKHLIFAERPTRELWTPIAPLWMIITLVIMLSGVWAHYLYAVIQLLKIRSLARKKD